MSQVSKGTFNNTWSFSHETSPGVLHPAQGSSKQERSGLVRVSPEEATKTFRGLWSQVERAGGKEGSGKTSLKPSSTLEVSV